MAVRIVSDDWLDGYRQGIIEALEDPDEARHYLTVHEEYKEFVQVRPEHTGTEDDDAASR